MFVDKYFLIVVKSSRILYIGTKKSAILECNIFCTYLTYEIKFNNT